MEDILVKCYIKDYPRPQLVRNSWMNLNGEWNFRFDDKDEGENEEWSKGFESKIKIKVPFTYETPASGIGEESFHPVVWYSKSIDLTKIAVSELLALHFEGSDYHTKVWVNGHFVGEHFGGYARFSMQIENFIHPGENQFVIRVQDSMDPRQPRGKQRWIKDNFGCWYVQTTGIWKTVWLESLSKCYIKHVKMTPDLKNSSLVLEADIMGSNAGEIQFEAEASFQGVRAGCVKGDVKNGMMKTVLNIASTDVTEWGIKKWDPESPDLYDICFSVFCDGKICDTVQSYFGMREIEIKGNQVLLNGAPLYQRLILDQGYWKDSHLTPPNEEALIEDIDKIMQLGYNGLRKHQKIEDERFLYWCDVKGMLVWSEMAASYVFDDIAVEMFTREWMEIIRQNYNHPSIIAWTPFNESWGVPQIRTVVQQQSFTQGIYYLTKTFDTTRPVIVNDGWEHTISDIITLHDYREKGDDFFERYTVRMPEILAGKITHSDDHFAFAEGFSYQGQPILISEYGGIAFQTDSGWGYGNQAASDDEFFKRFESITSAIQNIPDICGFCYTQVSHVQQEKNGLMDIQRNFVSEPSKICEVNQRRRV